MKNASIKHRIAAGLTDWIIIGIISFCIIILSVIDSLNVVENKELLSDIRVILSTTLLSWICFIIVVAYFTIVPVLLKGQTIGKKLFKIKVIKKDGSNVDFLTMFIREICGKILVDLLTIGLALLSRLLVVSLTTKHYTFHDELSSTRVIDVE